MGNLKSGNDFDEVKEAPGEKSIYWWTFLTAVLGITLVAFSIFYIWLYIHKLQNGYRLAKLHEQQDTMLSIERKLKLEWSRFQDPFEMEELGRKQFGLEPPKQDHRLVMR